GYAGAITLGHGAFFAAGAYITAVLVAKHDWDPYATLPVSAALCWVGGLLFGIPALRLRGLYLALGTLTLAVAVPPLLKRFEGLTGGHQGIVVSTPMAPQVLGLADSQWIYLTILVIAAVLFLVA